jgi:hypothetical protein
MSLWPKPQVRRIRFHDLRHTTAALLLRAGVPLASVQKLLRHRDPRITVEVYGPPGQPRSRLLHPCRKPRLGKAKGPEPAGSYPSDSEPFQQRAIQDSNLWPLAPEANALSS